MRLQPPKHICISFMSFFYGALPANCLFADLSPILNYQHRHFNKAYSHNINACTKSIAFQTEFVSLLAPNGQGDS